MVTRKTRRFPRIAQSPEKRYTSSVEIRRKMRTRFRRDALGTDVHIHCIICSLCVRARHANNMRKAPKGEIERKTKRVFSGYMPRNNTRTTLNRPKTLEDFRKTPSGVSTRGKYWKIYVNRSMHRTSSDGKR